MKHTASMYEARGRDNAARMHAHLEGVLLQENLESLHAHLVLLHAHQEKLESRATLNGAPRGRSASGAAAPCTARSRLRAGERMDGGGGGKWEVCEQVNGLGERERMD